MSEIAEREISERIKGMTLEEQKFVAGNLPDSVLWNELQKRYSKVKSRLEIIENTVSM